MKNPLFFIVLLIVSKSIAQNDPKTAFQKSRYELALSYYKKADFEKALDLFHFASKIKPETAIGQESIKKVDTLKTVLRENIMAHAVGTWKMAGDKPIWATTQPQPEKDFDELIDINQKEILFYQVNKKTKEKKTIKSEELIYYNKEESDAMFSDIILSDGTIWNCMINQNADELHVINVGKKDENGFEKIESDNMELFYTKVK